MTGNDNKKLGWIARVALALFVLFGASQSYAACVQGDLAGTWYFNGVTGDTFAGQFWETDFCKVRVNSVGTIVKSKSQCQYRDYTGKQSYDITGGSLVISSSCKITGKIKYDFGGGLTTNFNIDAARLDKGKTVITIAGRASIDPDIVSFFTGVKK